MSEAVARLAVGLDSLDDWNKRPWALGIVAGRWTYIDEAQKRLYDVVRYEPPADHPLAGQDKTFLPYECGASRAGIRGVRRVPYRLPDLRKATAEGRIVLHVEGERHAEKLSNMGFVATTTVSGSGSWRDEYADHYEGASLIAVIPDNDEPGRKYARAVTLSMQRRKIPVRIVELPGLSEGGDVLDWIDNGGTAERLRSIISEVPEADIIDDNDKSGAASNEMDGTPDSGQILTSWIQGDTEQSNKEALSALRALDPIEYDQIRNEAAQRLGCRLSTLDDEVKRGRADEKEEITLFEEPLPWPERVDGAVLLKEIRDVLQKFVAFPIYAATTCALWALHTYVVEAAEASPILAVTSPEKRCGKTTLLSILASIVYRPAGGSAFTRASVYRVVEKFTPTLLIDEADTFLGSGDKPELRGIINSGHTRRMAHVWVCVGEDHEPTRFSTWAPKAIACIGTLADTIEDRSIEIRMRRRIKSESVERFREHVVGDLYDLRRRCRRWADDNVEALRLDAPDVPPELSDRAADSWATLLAIADTAGGVWPGDARNAAMKISGKGITDSPTIATELLRDLHHIFGKPKTQLQFHRATFWKL